MYSFGNRLKNLRKERGLSQQKAAIEIGIVQSLLSFYETGVRKPSKKDMQKIYEYYDVGPDYFGLNSISEYIGFGVENAVTRSELCRLTGWTDRRVRQEIEDARHDGEIIINRQDGNGYYKPVLISDIEFQYRQNESRAKSILHYQKFLRKALKDAGRL